MRRVFIDPDRSLSTLAVVAEAPTGVLYGARCAGLASAVRWTEGYLVPLGMFGDATAQLRASFHVAHDCAYGCVPDTQREVNPANMSGLPLDRLEPLRLAVQSIWHVELDENRLWELVESWVPVFLRGAPGILVWPNCR
jgi:hypothetical protein